MSEKRLHTSTEAINAHNASWASLGLGRDDQFKTLFCTVEYFIPGHLRPVFQTYNFIVGKEYCHISCFFSVRSSYTKPFDTAILNLLPNRENMEVLISEFLSKLRQKRILAVTAIPIDPVNSRPSPM